MSDGSDDCAARLESAYRHIDVTRMRDMPLRNARLNVEAVGFRPYQAHQLGVMITPWFMNLVLIPDRGGGDSIAAGQRSRWRFPGESVEFISSPLPGFGWIHSAALFTTVSAFNDQDEARQIATTVLQRLFEGPGEDAGEARQADAPDDATGGRRLSRRDLFRGLLPRGD